MDVEPAKYFVLVTKREKRACRSCEELGVVSAPLPPRIIEKCLASDCIVIDTVVSKYCNHTPLHRQSKVTEHLSHSPPPKSVHYCSLLSYVLTRIKKCPLS